MTWSISIREKYDPQLNDVAIGRELKKLNSSVIEPPKKTKPIPVEKHGFQYADFICQKAKFRAVFDNNQLIQVAKSGHVIKNGSLFEYAKKLFK